jgi:hypothetical protein
LVWLYRTWLKRFGRFGCLNPHNLLKFGPEAETLYKRFKTFSSIRIYYKQTFFGLRTGLKRSEFQSEIDKKTREKQNKESEYLGDQFERGGRLGSTPSRVGALKLDPGQRPILVGEQREHFLGVPQQRAPGHRGLLRGSETCTLKIIDFQMQSTQ